MASRDPRRPNVVFILSDDQGPWALGCAGNPEIHTPHLDALAASGVRLSRFFSVSPVCSPARASLFTGLIPSAHGVHDWLSGPSPDDHLADLRLFTDDLADAGYRLALVGKWHLGANLRPRPGFVHWYAHPSGGGPYYGATMMGSQVDGYLTDALTTQATDFIDRESDRGEPFYLSLHYTAPHKPWKGQHPPEFESLYASCTFASCPQEPAHPWQPLDTDGVPVGGETDVRAALIGYFAAVTAMDAGIGRVLATLEARGLTASTLVIFTSDNGFNCGHHGIWGKGNGTFPQNMYDTSVMVPAIFSQPGRIPQGLVYDALVSGYDLRPTLMDHLGLPCAGEGPGRSFATFDDRSGAEVVVYDEYGPVRMIRTEGWKYVHRYPYGPHELYDLEQDPDERHNLAHAGLPELAELRDRLDSWFARHADPRLDGSRLPVNGSGQHSPAALGAFEPAPYRTEPR
ncbi:sulfatase-like hydrolase/transferase [Nonomuraea angiospora]|uniref:sulfatase-like hydrolase/transferase n=1 Tax=Nonomuraea angiospora TaxID=46172 RepID=UPI0029B690F0|nr:sulfatase-like hydrolase/transferase [Nonomuraea angiospora]MDX3103700.1 sulfatase-like hydrolase/transferase [Nonomuraea angiospora]